MSLTNLPVQLRLRFLLDDKVASTQQTGSVVEIDHVGDIVQESDESFGVLESSVVTISRI